MPHCSDGSDEDEKLNCETIEIGKSELCTGNYTECFDSSNVTICSKNCDGVPECAYEDDEDEKECGNDSKVRTATITPKVITSEEFPEKYQNDYIWSVIIKSYDCRASIVLKIHELYIEQDDEFRENGSILCYDYLLWFEGEKSTIDFQLNTVRKFSKFYRSIFAFRFLLSKFFAWSFRFIVQLDFKSPKNALRKKFIFGFCGAQVEVALEIGLSLFDCCKFDKNLKF